MPVLWMPAFARAEWRSWYFFTRSSAGMTRRVFFAGWNDGLVVGDASVRNGALFRALSDLLGHREPGDPIPSVELAWRALLAKLDQQKLTAGNEPVGFDDQFQGFIREE